MGLKKVEGLTDGRRWLCFAAGREPSGESEASGGKPSQRRDSSNSERATRMSSLVAVNESEAEAVVAGANIQSRLLSRELELGS